MIILQKLLMINKSRCFQNSSRITSNFFRFFHSSFSSSIDIDALLQKSLNEHRQRSQTSITSNKRIQFSVEDKNNDLKTKNNKRFENNGRFKNNDFKFKDNKNNNYNRSNDKPRNNRNGNRSSNKPNIITVKDNETTSNIEYISINKRTNKRMKFLLPSLSFKATDCLKHVIDMIYNSNSEGLVNYLDPELHDIETLNIRTLFQQKSWDFEKNGLIIARLQEMDNQFEIREEEKERIPLVKCVERRIAIQKYSDELAQKKAAEMAQISHKFANITAKNKKKSNTNNEFKFVKVSWEISNADLKSTKIKEIESLAHKSNLIMIIVDSKKSLDRVNLSNPDLNLIQGFESMKQENDLELLARQKTFKLLIDQLKEKFENSKYELNYTGTPEGRVIVTLKFTKIQEVKSLEKLNIDKKSSISFENLDEIEDIMQIDLSSIDDKKLLKEIRKRQRKEKQKIREERKKGSTI